MEPQVSIILQIAAATLIKTLMTLCLDYAIDIFHEVIKTGKYKCFLGENTRLPMIYLPDLIRGTVEFLEAPSESIKMR